ncbi:MAG: hypothetical protein JWP27_701 [Flaviaesturariibacter sp.]|nr:hypothetical protein [Flaviaesturariibacter sp.]
MQGQVPPTDPDGTRVIPVIEEFMTVDKEMVETAKVYITKRSDVKDATVNIPLVREGYTIERRPVKSKVYEKAPPTRYEGENIIIPVVQEVLVIEKRYEVIEEVHVIKTRTETPHIQQVPLMKEEVIVERVPIERGQSNL